MLPAGSAAYDPLGKLMKPASAVWFLVVTIGSRQVKPTDAPAGEAVETALAEAVTATGVSPTAGVTRFGGWCDVGLAPQAAVSARTPKMTSRRRETLPTGNHRGNAGRRQVLGKGALRVRNNPDVEHRRCWSDG